MTEKAPSEDSPKVTAAQRGATLVEYALLLALIFVVVVSAVSVLGETTSATISEINVPLN